MPEAPIALAIATAQPESQWAMVAIFAAVDSKSPSTMVSDPRIFASSFTSSISLRMSARCAMTLEELVR